MNGELFIAKRIYKSNHSKEKRVSSPTIRIATLGIALGLAVMIISVCIIIGFKHNIRDKIVGFVSHIQITSFDNNSSYELNPISYSDSLQTRLRNNPEIAHVQKFITKPGIIKTDSDFQGIVLKGVSDDFDWTFFQKSMVEGSIIDFNDTTGTNQALISRKIANLLHLAVGDKFTTYFVQDPIRARRFEITGIYETSFEDYDKLYVITNFDVLSNLNGWNPDMVSGVEVLVKDDNKLEKTTQDLFFEMSTYTDRFGNALYVRSMKDINPLIFNWLDLLDMNVWIILILMLLVSGFTMISGLLIIILERTNMIGMLKSMGARDYSIRKIFLYLSFFLIGRGMLWGNVFGLSLCFLQKEFQLIKLDAATYYLTAVPVELNLWYIVLLNLGTLVVSLLMMIAPSYLVTKIVPAKSIRFT